MFLKCSYFFPNLSLDVLIDLVLNQKNACTSNVDMENCDHQRDREGQVSPYTRERLLQI